MTAVRERTRAGKPIRGSHDVAEHDEPAAESCACRRGPQLCLLHFAEMSIPEQEMLRVRLGLQRHRGRGPASQQIRRVT